MLRRVAGARAIQGSNSIEGLHVTLDDAVAAVGGGDPLDASPHVWPAIQGYRDALTFILQLADDPSFVYDASLLKSLHFMMTKDDMRSGPGRWRSGHVYVRDERTQELVYEGPDALEVPNLVAELVAELREPDDAQPAVVRAAMAHLNLVMIHPFRDGNAGWPRALQSLVLARAGVLAPAFASIEEYLGRHTQAYYAVLGEVGGGSWQPCRDARPWIRFALTAHLQQIQTLRRRATRPSAAGSCWSGRLGLGACRSDRSPACSTPPRASAFETPSIASSPRSAKSWLAAIYSCWRPAGLLEARGQRRGRYYVASEKLAVSKRRSIATVRRSPIRSKPDQPRATLPTLGDGCRSAERRSHDVSGQPV